MSAAKTMAKIAGGLVGVVLLGAGGAFLWAKSATADRLAKHYETHRVDFPIPFPLTEAEIGELRAGQPDGVDVAQVARERAAARGKHLVEARYVCVECHGKNFGGGTMIDAPPIGKILGMNITSGPGGVVANYKAADWDRIVRHGVLTDGRAAAMPSIDFVGMSDRELSDIVSYIQTVPPVAGDVPRPTLGPVGTFLVATGKIILSADEIDHQKPHPVEPPEASESVEFGRHLVGVCMGCHTQTLAGGPIPGGDPSWPPAANLTPHAEGIAGWTFADFTRALREGKSKSGAELRPPMALMKGYAANLTDTELKAMWAYLQTVPPAPDPKP